MLATASHYILCFTSILLDGSNINGLGVITQPVAEIDTLDIELAELLVAANDASGEESEESVFNIAVTPVLAFDLARRGDVTSTKGLGRASKVDEGDEEDGEEDGGFERHGRHDVCG
jgi:hypothetical protein